MNRIAKYLDPRVTEAPLSVAILQSNFTKEDLDRELETGIAIGLSRAHYATTFEMLAVCGLGLVIGFGIRDLIDWFS